MKKPDNFIRAKLAHRAISALHPELFSLENPVPFKVGINADLAVRFPKMPPYVRNTMLFWLTVRRAYLRSCAPGAQRFGFDGPDGFVTAEQSKFAFDKAKLRDEIEIERLRRRLERAAA